MWPLIYFFIHNSMKLYTRLLDVSLSLNDVSSYITSVCGIRVRIKKQYGVTMKCLRLFKAPLMVITMLCFIFLHTLPILGFWIGLCCAGMLESLLYLILCLRIDWEDQCRKVSFLKIFALQIKSDLLEIDTLSIIYVFLTLIYLNIIFWDNNSWIKRNKSTMEFFFHNLVLFSFPYR